MAHSVADTPSVVQSLGSSSKRWTLAFVALLLLLAGATISWAQRPANGLKAFTAPNGVFQFKHSDSLIPCERQKQGAEDDFFWTPDSCAAYIPICDDQGSQGNVTIACFAYLRDEFEEKPAFGGAAFSVEKVTKVANEKDCLSESPGWVVDEKDSGGTIMINGVRFKVLETDGVAKSHSMDGRLYRTFHAGQCYQLSIRWMMTNQGVFDPEVKKFTPSDWNRVNHSVEQARDSFRFLK